MNVAKYFWDVNEAEQKALGRVLQDPLHPRFLQRATTLLTRCDRPKELFLFMPKKTFLNAWPNIRSYWMKRERQSDARDWWETLYEQFSSRGLSISKGGPSAVYRKIGSAIKDKRIERGLSQRQLAVQTQISQPVISQVEEGRKNITLFTLIRLCKILGIQTLDLA